MNPMVPDALRNPRIPAVYAEHFARMRDLHTGKTPDAPFRLWGAGCASDRLDVPPEEAADNMLEQLAQYADGAADTKVFRPLSVTADPRGVHFIDHIFGAETFQIDGSWQVHTLGTPVGQLRMADVDADEGVAYTRRFALQLLEHDLPAVHLGMPTLSSVLNIAVNLYGQEIILAMLVDPDAATHDLAIIDRVIRACHAWYLEHVPAEARQPIVAPARCQPPGRGQLCGCTTQLLSPELYRDFIAPLDEAMLAMYPGGGMIHLCGRHTQHIPCWRAMAPLKAVQLNDAAAEDLEAYANGLRDDQVLYVNPCPGMPEDRVLEITGGRRLVLVAHGN